MYHKDHNLEWKFIVNTRNRIYKTLGNTIKADKIINLFNCSPDFYYQKTKWQLPYENEWQMNSSMLIIKLTIVHLYQHLIWLIFKINIFVYIHI